MSLDQFRADFALVWKTWIAQTHETPESYQAAGKAVKQNLNDSDWMAGASAHFAQLADTIRRDLARSERIRAEVRANKQRRAA